MVNFNDFYGTTMKVYRIEAGSPNYTVANEGKNYTLEPMYLIYS